MGQFWKKLWTFMWCKVSQFVKTYMLRSRASDLWIGDKDQLSMMKYGKVSSGIKMDIHRNIKHYDSQPETTTNHPKKHSPVSISRLPYKCYICQTSCIYRMIPESNNQYSSNSNCHHAILHQPNKHQENSGYRIRKWPGTDRSHSRTITVKLS